MDDINRYLAEAIRIRRTIQVYSELFNSEESTNVLTQKALQISAIFKRSMHDEILMSFSRLFDSNGYRIKGETEEYLSQINIISKHEEILTDDAVSLRKRTTELWEQMEIKNYRDLKIAHNNKAILTGKKESISHQVSFDTAVELIETSIKLMLELKSSLNELSISVNLNEKYSGIGNEFIGLLKKI